MLVLRGVVDATASVEPGEGVEDWRSGRRGDGDGLGIVRDREEALLCVEDAAFVVDMVVWEERFPSADHGVDLLLLRIDDLRSDG